MVVLDLYIFILPNIYHSIKGTKNGKVPLISSYKSELVNVFCFENILEQQSQNIPITQNLIVENEENYIIKSDYEQQTYETDLTYLQEILNKLYTIQILYILLFTT